MQKVFIIFDIGKTNKKYFLFDRDLNIVEQQTIIFKEKPDDDGFLSDDLEGIVEWIKKSVLKTLQNKTYEVAGINFSTYGASLVHLGLDGEIVSPFYNYLKPLDKATTDLFFNKFGPEANFETISGAPSNDCLLNSGMQLFWLKNCKPEVFRKIRFSLHFPQYLSFVFTGKYFSEFTSVGCHTALWDYRSGTYPEWLVKEEILHILPEVERTNVKVDTQFGDRIIPVGIGIHDSSAALIPYLHWSGFPFILISTGTWSVALNPYFEGQLSIEDTRRGCLNYMRTDGKVVRAGRIMLGAEYAYHIKILTHKYNKDIHYHATIQFDEETYFYISGFSNDFFQFRNFGTNREILDDISRFTTFEEAYFRLVFELVREQIDSLMLAKGATEIKRVYVDGGFVDNEVFLRILAIQLPQFEVFSSEVPDGSALGALLTLIDGENTGTLPHRMSIRKIEGIVSS
jgi:sugar (pentulose or hexulose) kinase